MENDKTHAVWNHPFVIADCKYEHKSLAAFNANIAIGCNHGCSFCQVPGVSTVKQSPNLRAYNVVDPDAEWGKYVLYRPFDEKVFLRSVAEMEMKPVSELP